MKNINWSNVLLIMVFVVFLITFSSEHRTHIITINHNKEIVKKSIEELKDIGTYYNIFKDNVSKIEEKEINNDTISVQKTTKDYEKIY